MSKPHLRVWTLEGEHEIAQSALLEQRRVLDITSFSDPQPKYIGHLEGHFTLAAHASPVIYQHDEWVTLLNGPLVIFSYGNIMLFHRKHGLFLARWDGTYTKPLAHVGKDGKKSVTWHPSIHYTSSGPHGRHPPASAMPHLAQLARFELLLQDDPGLAPIYADFCAECGWDERARQMRDRWAFDCPEDYLRAKGWKQKPEDARLWLDPEQPTDERGRQARPHPGNG